MFVFKYVCEVCIDWCFRDIWTCRGHVSQGLSWLSFLVFISVYFLTYWFWFMLPNATIFQLFLAGKFYWFSNLEYPEKTTDLLEITDKLYHLMLYGVHLVMNGVRIHNFCDDSHWLHKYIDELLLVLNIYIYY
jgi:hypothetical protein